MAEKIVVQESVKPAEEAPTKPKETTEEATKPAEEVFYAKEDGSEEKRDTEDKPQKETIEDAKQETVSEDKGEDKLLGKDDKAKESKEEGFNLKLPDNALITSDRIAEIESYAKSRGLSKEVAQDIVESENAVLANHINANKPGGPEWAKRVSEWENLALKDEEIGGSEEKLKASAMLGKKALVEFFPETIGQFLNETGLGSHPDIIKGLVKIGKAMADDQVERGQFRQHKKDKSIEEIFYPKMRRETD